MKNDLQVVRGEEGQYRHVDGTFELTFGSIFLLAAACFWSVTRLAVSHSLMANKIMPFITVGVFLGGGILVDALVKWVKRRFTLPRIIPLEKVVSQATQQPAQMLIWIGIPVLTVILMLVLFANRLHFQGGNQDPANLMLPAIWGAMFCILWLLVGKKIGLNRSYLIAVVSLAIGGALFVNRAEGQIAMVILFGALGIALAISGSITLWQYLQATVLPKEIDPEV